MQSLFLSWASLLEEENESSLTRITIAGLFLRSSIMRWSYSLEGFNKDYLIRVTVVCHQACLRAVVRFIILIRVIFQIFSRSHKTLLLVLPNLSSFFSFGHLYL
ncbi:uncharacterized protein DS421_11g338230 [Arachis hypogaea]|nr:uncharacterized protein DS421_11g338230 [Arachis hypogaea]